MQVYLQTAINSTQAPDSNILEAVKDLTKVSPTAFDNRSAVPIESKCDRV